MSITRRTLLQGIVGAAAAAGLLLPTVPSLEENVAAARRYWALGAIPTQPEPGVWLSGRFDASDGWQIIPVGARAYWTDGRITEHPLKVLPDKLWRVDVPRQEFHTDDDAFSLTVRYLKQGDPDGSVTTTHTLSYLREWSSR